MQSKVIIISITIKTQKKTWPTHPMARWTRNSVMLVFHFFTPYFHPSRLFSQAFTLTGSPSINWLLVVKCTSRSPHCPPPQQETREVVKISIEVYNRQPYSLLGFCFLFLFRSSFPPMFCLCVCVYVSCQGAVVSVLQFIDIFSCLSVCSLFLRLPD